MEDKRSILVVDDSIVITNFIKRIFENSMKVLVAHDGYQAIQLIQNTNEPISGMLLDLNMPNCNGFQVLEYFKQNNLFEQIPVSLLTGEDSRVSIDKVFQYPVVDMLSKPFNAEQARNIVEKTVSMQNVKQR